MKLHYYMVNLLFIVIFVLGLVESIHTGDFKGIYIFIMLGILVIVNLLMFILIKLLGKGIDYILSKYDQRKMKNYNMLEWMGEAIWLDLYHDLAKKKVFDRHNISNNYNDIKEIVKEKYKSEKELRSLELYLEVRNESQVLKTLNTVTQTTLVAIITSSLVSFMNGMITLKSSGVIYLVIFMVVWIMLMIAINYFSKEMSKDKLLLKLVKECTSEIAST
ncbi:hypothetical protein C2I06_10355 [Niallia circulans]|uniref:hypothetical protein n=1 Tax=Niallia circulans TaxID=1397 RepID=UPI000F45373B|nr:hypothetical protein [Niallia circulans]AYV67245.1 hypothetical protein C2I06_10355 [Niallia circulans]